MSSKNQLAVAEYLNTDLELRSNEDLSALADWFDQRAVVLHNGWLGEDQYLLTLETNCGCGDGESCQVGDPGATIARFLGVASALPPSLQSMWDRCSSRRLDVGIQLKLSACPVGDGSYADLRAQEVLLSCGFSVGEDIVRAMKSVNATLHVTLYPANPRSCSQN